MKQNPVIFWIISFLTIWLCIACFASAKPSQAPYPLTLTPWVWLTPTPSPTVAVVIPTFTVPSPFYQTYIIKEGDTLSEIAFRYNLTIEDLLLANEGLDARIIPLGATIIIPQKKENKLVLPTPTALPLTLFPIQCYPSLPAGQWCLAVIQNQYPDPVDDVSAVISLYREDGSQVAEQQVALPLSRLEAGKSLPFYAFFPQSLQNPYAPYIQLLSALPSHNGDGRFLPLSIQVEEETRLEKDKAIHLRGKIVLAINDPTKMTYIRLAATAYDARQIPIGVKVWDWKGNINFSQGVPFDITIFSLSAPIANIDLQAEASLQ